MKILSITNTQINTMNSFKKCKQCQSEFFLDLVMVMMEIFVRNIVGINLKNLNIQITKIK